MKIRVEGLSEVKAAIDQVEKLLLQTIGESIRNEAADTKAFKHGTKFDNNIITKPYGRHGQLVWSKSKWSGWLEFGNNQGGPYIYPRTAKALHFYIGGNEIFAKRVRSHGPLKFMEPAVDKVMPEVPEMFASCWNQVF